MIAVVTGGSGFIGSHLVAALRAREAEVRLLRRTEIDLLDRDAVVRSAIWDGATHCFHLAGVTRARTRAAFLRGNTIPTAHIATALAERRGQGTRLIHFSSLAAAGPSGADGRPRTETDEPAPVEPYGWSNLLAERALISRARDLAFTVLRPAAVYGPGDRDFLQVFRQATGRVAFHAAPIDQPISIAHVRDVVAAALVAASASAAIGRTYFVANEASVTWRALYATVAAMAGTTPRQVQVPPWCLRTAALMADLVPRVGTPPLLTRHKATLALQHSWLCDSARARAELGWAPVVTFDAGMQETFDWYRVRGWLTMHAAAPAATA